MATESTTLFLSYAREDDEAFVERLDADLRERGFDVWWDRRRMPSRGRTFIHEIRDAIDRCERFLLVLGPNAAVSEHVVSEWHRAITFGKPITVVLRQGDYESLPSELRLLHAEDFRGDESYDRHLVKLVRQLSEPVPPLGKLFGVPRPPRHLLARPDSVASLRNLVLADLTRPVVPSEVTSVTGVQGMGGIGKSVLANLVARDLDVRRAFHDGVLWVPIGPDPDLPALQQAIAEVFGGDLGHLDDTHRGRTALSSLLEDKAVLLILDDVWERRHADAVCVPGPKGRALVTTRDAGLVSSLGGQLYPVDLPEEPEAMRLLAGAAQADVDTLPPVAGKIVRECGRLPLAIALCGGMARAGFTWQGVLGRLRDAALERIRDRHAEPEHHRSLWAAIQVSVDALSSEERGRFLELGVFAQHGAIPEAAVRMLWSHGAGLGGYACEDLLLSLSERSLVQIERPARPEDGASGRRVRMHDLVYDYVTRVSEAGAAPHQLLLPAYASKCTEGWATGPDDGYFYQWLVHHLSQAGRSAEASALLFDYRWLATKLDRSLSRSLERDCQLVLHSGATTLSGEEVAYLGYLRELVVPLPSSERLATLLWGHFAGTELPRLWDLLEQAKALSGHPWLRPVTPSLSVAATGLVRAIDDAGPVQSLAVGDTIDGEALVAAVVEPPDSSPQRLRVWRGGGELQERLFLRRYPTDEGEAVKHTITAINLPQDRRPALLQSWIDPTRGTCCRLLDLSAATDDRLFRELGSTMDLGEEEPCSVGVAGGRLVLLTYLPAKLAVRWSSLEVFEAKPARARLWDIETGQPVPEPTWSIRDSSRPFLVGETRGGAPFLVLVPAAEGRPAIHVAGSPEPVPLTWMSFADRPVLSRWRGGPVIVKGGLDGLEIVDPDTARSVGRFSKHRDEETLLATIPASDGRHLVASVGRLGSRGRFSTSVRIWDVETQTQVSPTGTEHTGEIKTITSGIYRGEPVFATGSHDLICLWRARPQAGYSEEQEPHEIPDPNVCDRRPADRLPPGHRHHDLGAVCVVGDKVLTWSSARSDIDSLNSTHREWTLGPPAPNGRRPGVASSSLDTGHGSDVMAVWSAGEGEMNPVITTIRRDGTRRTWTFSLRADWERQSSHWLYWHCVSVRGPMADGRRIAMSVDPLAGSFEMSLEDHSVLHNLSFDPGCPATQCALAEDGRTVVVFDERGVSHHLEPMIPPNRGPR